MGGRLQRSDWRKPRDGARSTAEAVYGDGKRIIFRVCEECIRKHQEALSPLACCLDPERPLHVVTFVDFGDYHIGAGRRRLRPAQQYDVRNEGPEG